MKLSNILVILAVNLKSLCHCFPSQIEEKEDISKNLFSETVLWPEAERNHTNEGPDYYFHKGKIFMLHFPLL